MNRQEAWLRFVISGEIKDYMAYTNARQMEEKSYAGENSFYNRRSCDTGAECRGKRSPDICSYP